MIMSLLKPRNIFSNSICTSFYFPYLSLTGANYYHCFKWWNRELTLKGKFKCYVKPMKDPLGASPSKGNQGTTRGKEKILLTSVGIEPTTSGLNLPLLCRLSYEVGQRESGTIKVVNRGEEKVRVHINVVPRSTMNTNGGTENSL